MRFVGKVSAGPTPAIELSFNGATVRNLVNIEQIAEAAASLAAQFIGSRYDLDSISLNLVSHLELDNITFSLSQLKCASDVELVLSCFQGLKGRVWCSPDELICRVMLAHGVTSKLERQECLPVLTRVIEYLVAIGKVEKHSSQGLLRNQSLGIRRYHSSLVELIQSEADLQGEEVDRLISALADALQIMEPDQIKQLSDGLSLELSTRSRKVLKENQSLLAQDNSIVL